MIELVPDSRPGQQGSWVARTADDAAAMLALGYPPFVYPVGQFLERMTKPGGAAVAFRCDLPGQTEPA